MKAYCIRNYYEYEEIEESFSFKWILKPLGDALDKLMDWIGDEMSWRFILLFLPSFLLFLMLVLVCFSIRRFGFKKITIFECNSSYDVPDEEISSDNNIVRIKFQEFSKKKKISDLESMFYPKFSRYFTDLKGYRKFKLKKIRRFKFF